MFMLSDFCDRREILRFSGTALATIGTAGCLSKQSSTDQTITMTSDFKFDPETAAIEPGETVNWENTSDTDHTVTAYGDKIPDEAAYFASGDFESEQAAKNQVNEGLLAPNDEYQHTFEQPGTYEYYCIPHESSEMIGMIRVE